MTDQKLNELQKKLKTYEEKLVGEMKGYRGVIHESAYSENKHNQVMVLKDIVQSLKQEIKNLEDTGKKP